MFKWIFRCFCLFLSNQKKYSAEFCDLAGYAALGYYFAKSAKWSPLGNVLSRHGRRQRHKFKSNHDKAVTFNKCPFVMFITFLQGYIVYESINFRDYYIRHQKYWLKISREDGSTLLHKDLSFLALNKQICS